MKILNIIEKSQEWYDLRSEKIGASDVPIIMGVSPHKKRYELLAEKKGDLHSTIPKFLLKKANKAEKTAITFIELIDNVYIEKLCVQCDSIPYLICSLDGYDKENNSIYEIKLYNKVYARDLKYSIIPEHFNLQVQTQMFVTGAKQCNLVLSSEDVSKILITRIKPQPEVVKRILPAIQAFYYEMRKDKK